MKRARRAIVAAGVAGASLLMMAAPASAYTLFQGGATCSNGWRMGGKIYSYGVYHADFIEPDVGQAWEKFSYNPDQTGWSYFTSATNSGYITGHAWVEQWDSLGYHSTYGYAYPICWG